MYHLYKDKNQYSKNPRLDERIFTSGFSPCTSPNVEMISIKYGIYISRENRNRDLSILHLISDAAIVSSRFANLGRKCGRVARNSNEHVSILLINRDETF